MKIIAIVGQPSSGKDSAARYLAQHYGMIHISSGDVLRHYIKANRLGGLDRANMQKVVTSLRAHRGNAVLVDVALREADRSKDLLISGLRHPAEGEKIIQEGGLLVALTAPAELRYKRAIRRGRVGEHITYDEFVELEQKENQGLAFNTNKLIEMASYKVSNQGSYKRFLHKLDELMEQLGFDKH